MPKKRSKKKKASDPIPKHGRSEKSVRKELGLRKFSADVPLGNTSPTVVRGVMYGGMPNASRRATGRMYEQRGRRG